MLLVVGTGVMRRVHSWHFFLFKTPTTVNLQYVFVMSASYVPMEQLRGDAKLVKVKTAKEKKQKKQKQKRKVQKI